MKIVWSEFHLTVFNRVVGVGFLGFSSFSQSAITVMVTMFLSYIFSCCSSKPRQTFCLAYHINIFFFYLASPTVSNGDNEEEIKLLQSEIWTTLFRGGYMTGKLQRSLSGHHVSDDVSFYTTNTHSER